MRPVVLVSGCAGDTRRYRAWHAAESLALAGRRVAVRTVEGEPPTAADLAGGATLILHRVAWHPAVDGWIAAARAAGGRVLYDTDDLVFDAAFAARAAALRARAGADAPRTADAADGVDAAAAAGAPAAVDAPGGGDWVAPSDAARAFAPPAHYARVLAACDGCITATAPLAAAVARLGRPARVVPNAIDLELWQLSDRAWQARRPQPDGAIVLGYASGTATHDADFAVAAAAIEAVLEAVAGARLRIVGPLALDGRWDRFAGRVERLAYLPWRRLPAALAGFDINLAPLDIADPFCAAKSELKWFEAGAVGVPTVASPIPALAVAVDDGRDGWLAPDADAWRAALLALAADPDRRAAIGRAARGAVRDRYLTDVRAADWAAALAALEGDAAAGAADPGAAVVPVVAVDDAAVERFAMGAEAVLAARAVAAAPHVAAVGPWLAARLGMERAKATSSPAAPAAAGTDHPVVAALPYPVDQATFDGASVVGGDGAGGGRSAGGGRDDAGGRIGGGGDGGGRGPGGAPRPRLLCDLALARDSTRALALEALHAAADAVPQLEVRLYGSDPAAPPPDPAAVDRPGWRWLGPLDAAARAELFAAGGVLVAPLYGNVPLPVVEAMAAGLAVAALDVPSVRWLLRDGATAVLGAGGGAALGAAAARLAADAPLRRRVAAAGRDAVARHSAGRFAAALAAVAHGGPPPPAPWAWRLVALQHLGDDPGPPLGDGDGGAGLAFVAAADGLCRIDLRLACPDGVDLDGRPRWRPLTAAERGQLRLRVAPGLPAPGVAAVRTAAAAGSAGDDWVRFDVEPLDDCAGRWWTATVTDAHDASVATGPLPRLLGAASDAFPDGHTVVGDAVATGWSPACRVWAAPPAPLPALVPAPNAPALFAAFARAAADQAEWRRREAIAAALWPLRAARWLARLDAPLPPIDRRPWPSDAAPLRKAWGTLRHYGPLALLREAAAALRWRRLDDAARAAARDQNTA